MSVGIVADYRQPKARCRASAARDGNWELDSIAATFSGMTGPGSSLYLEVFVPSTGSTLHAFVKPGAGMVGLPEGGKVRIHFEANEHGLRWLDRYANRVFKAVEKLAEKSDQESRLVEKAEIVRVGEWNDDRNEVDLYKPNSKELAAWLGRENIHETDDELIYKHL